MPDLGPAAAVCSTSRGRRPCPPGLLGRTGGCRARGTAPSGWGGGGRWSPPRSRRGRSCGGAVLAGRPGGAKRRPLRSDRCSRGATARHCPGNRPWAARPGSGPRPEVAAGRWGRCLPRAGRAGRGETAQGRRKARMRSRGDRGRASGGCRRTFGGRRQVSEGRRRASEGRRRVSEGRRRASEGHASRGRPAGHAGRRRPSAGTWVSVGSSGGVGRKRAGESPGVGGWGRAALPCSCTPRFLMSRARSRTRAVVPCSLPRPGRTRPTRHAYPHGRVVIPASVRPGTPPTCVRVTLRVDPGRTGTSPGPGVHLPGTSPYPAVILHGRLRS